jgi:hypothetical protein
MLELKKIFGDRVGRDIFFYSISIDPFNDTPAALKAYADRFNVGAGWMFLTGDEKDIAVVTRKLGLGALQATSSRDRHSTTPHGGQRAIRPMDEALGNGQPEVPGGKHRDFPRLAPHAAAEGLLRGSSA